MCLNMYQLGFMQVVRVFVLYLTALGQRSSGWNCRSLSLEKNLKHKKLRCDILNVVFYLKPKYVDP